MDPRERWADTEEALRVALDSLRASMWTAMPGIVVSFDAARVVASIKVAIGGVKFDASGKATATNYPLLEDVPVVFPHGGGGTLTFPIKPDDEVLLVFASRPIDAWWQSGGVQRPFNARTHDLSDAFAIPGPMSQARKIGGISTTKAQFRSDDGQAVIDIDPASHAIGITTTGNVTATAGGNASVQATGTITAHSGGDLTAQSDGSATVQAAGSLTLTAATIVLNGATTINGPTSFNGPVSQVAGTQGGGSSNFDGPVVVTGDVTAAGKSVSTHTHQYVDNPSGTLTTSTPN